jgi:hypothetical protein
MTATTKVRPAGTVAAAAAGIALALGLGACSTGSTTPAAPARSAHFASGGAGANPGGATIVATPGQRARALTALRAADPAGARETQQAGVNGALSHLLSSLPAAELPEVSRNWSGYQVLSARTGRAATSASGSWVVPAVTVPGHGEAGYSSIWVGVGGSCLDAACHVGDRSLIQLGTSQFVSPSGQARYFAWYELLPAASVPVPALPVAPADTVSASLAVRGAPLPSRQTWVLSITVTAPSGTVRHWSKTVTYASSLASAEWIVEGPSTLCNGRVGELPLADYHTASFSHLAENGAPPAIGPSNLIVGYDPYGELSLPAPSFLLHGKTATYFVPFAPRGAAQAAGRAVCEPIGVKG